METNDRPKTISCPFCRSYDFEFKPGLVSCPICFTDFEIDDRGGCIYIDPNKPRLPIKGIFCKRCGLFQYEESDNCLNCGAPMKTVIV